MNHPFLAGIIAALAPLAGVLATDYVPVWAALVAGVVPLAGVYWSHRRAGKKIEEIHILVNSRLTQALDEIASLKVTLERKDAVIADQTKSKD